jgi:DNA polymerase III subunit delta
MPSASAHVPAPLCLVCGDDDFNVKARALQLFDQWSRELGGLDHEIIEARVLNSGEALTALARLREALQTLPFFGSAKVIWFRDCSFLGDERTAQAKDVTQTLASLVEELKAFRWDNVRLLVSAGKVDRRKSFYKTIEKLGTVEVFAALSLENKDWAAEAEAAALKVLRGLKKSSSDEALAELVNAVGPNLRQLHNEIEKIALYVGERACLEVSDVEAMVSRNKQARAFALGDALGDRDLPRVLRCLDEEMWTMQFDKDKSEIGLLYGLISKVRTLILLKEMEREKWLRPGTRDAAGIKAQLERVPPEKLPEDRRFNPAALHPYVLLKSMPQARSYSLDELVRAMELLLEANRRLLSGHDEKLVLQQAIVQIVRGERALPPAGATGRRETEAQIAKRI